jgi:RNA polymerase sigma factor (sigma-70 family)
MIDSYNMQVKFRNNYLLKLMRERGYETVAQLHRGCGESQQKLGRMLSLKDPLYAGARKQIRPSTIRLANFFGVEPEDLYPPEHHDIPLTNNVAEAEVSFQEATQMLSAPTIGRLEMAKDLAYAMDNSGLKIREKMIIDMRYAQGMTLKEVGDELNITGSRVRQIEVNAMRKLRNPKCGFAGAATFADYMEV